MLSRFASILPRTCSVAATSRTPITNTILQTTLLRNPAYAIRSVDQQQQQQRRTFLTSWFNLPTNPNSKIHKEIESVILNFNKKCPWSKFGVPGIYKLTSNRDGRIYVGKSRNMRKRIKAHVSDAFRYKYDRRDGHDFSQIAIALATQDFDFDYSILEVVSPHMDPHELDKRITERESYWIHALESYKPENGFNVAIPLPTNNNNNHTEDAGQSNHDDQNAPPQIRRQYHDALQEEIDRMEQLAILQEEEGKAGVQPGILEYNNNTQRRPVDHSRYMVASEYGPGFLIPTKKKGELSIDELDSMFETELESILNSTLSRKNNPTPQTPSPKQNDSSAELKTISSASSSSKEDDDASPLKPKRPRGRPRKQQQQQQQQQQTAYSS